MKTLMIGHSGSGKTSFIAGLYKEVITLTDLDLLIEDELKRETLERMVDNLSKGIYPSGTDIASQYNFWLSFENEKLLPFELYDYRGGALLESTKNSIDAQNLIKQMSTADAIIVFIDGNKIVNMTNIDLEKEYDILIWALQKSISLYKGTNFYLPISFVLTKGDMYDDPNVLLNSNGFKYFLPIINNIRNCSAVTGMIVVIEVTKTSTNNVLLPFVFSLYYGGLPHYIVDTEDTLNTDRNFFKSWKSSFLIKALTPFILRDYLYNPDIKSRCLENIKRGRLRLSKLRSLHEIFEEILKKFIEENLIIYLK